MMKKELLVAAVIMAVGFVEVVDSENTVEDAKQILVSYKNIVVNGKPEGEDCKTSDNAEKDIVYRWLGEVAGKTPEEIVGLTIETSRVRRAFGEHEQNVDLCAVSHDLYCKADYGEGTEVCTKCGGTCDKKFVELVLAATDWKDTVARQKGGKPSTSGSSPAAAPEASVKKPKEKTESEKNGAATAEVGHYFLLIAATLITTVHA